jgi:hypothetical protein
MTTVVNRVHQQARVESPVAHAFEFACQTDRLRQWNPYLEYLHMTGPLDKIGTTFDAVFDLLGQSTAYRGKVVEVVPQHLIRVHLVADHGSADWTWTFEPSDGHTMFSIDVEYQKEGVVAGMVDRFVYHAGMDRAVRHAVENFAALAPTAVPILA